MIYLILDTNIWLYLANGFDPMTNKHSGKHHFDFFNSLKVLKSNGDIEIIINEVVIEEWKRNKKAAHIYVEKLKNNLINFDKQFHQFTMYSQNTTSCEQIKKEYIDGIKNEIVLNETHIEKVEQFLIGNCTIVDISDKVKQTIFDLSIFKKAPFHKNKNNIADAAILLSSYDYIKDISSDEEIKAIFVSNNYEDFAESKNIEEFHPDIKALIDDKTILYKRNLPAALKLSNEIIAELEEFYKHQQWLESISFACVSDFCLDYEDFTPWGYLDNEIRIKYKSQINKYNPNQLELFPELPRMEIKEQKTHCGNCVVCDTFHLICPICGELTPLETEYDEDCACKFCKTKFHIEFNESTKILIIDDIEEEIED